ncbi:MAG: hypothetical protein P4N59_13555 [Negativicutes bacterium]|nr:hypothetical protein [Negativicutes bacterium]
MSRVIFSAKLIIGIGLMALLFHFGVINADDLAAVFAHPARLAGAVALVFLMLPISAYRWRLLLEVQGVAITIRHSLAALIHEGAESGRRM